MMKVKVFVKDECPNCPPAKDLGTALIGAGYPVDVHNISTVDGLTEAAMLGVMATPSVLVLGDDGSEVTGWRSAVPGMAEVEQVLRG